MERKIHCVMRDKGLLDPINVMINLSFTKKILEYPNSRKHKPLIINPYDGIKNPIGHIQTFQLHMHYLIVSIVIIC